LYFEFAWKYGVAELNSADILHLLVLVKIMFIFYRIFIYREADGRNSTAHDHKFANVAAVAIRKSVFCKSDHWKSKERSSMTR